MGSIGANQNRGGGTNNFSESSTREFNGTQTAPDEISFRNLYRQFNSVSGNPEIEFEGTTYTIAKALEWSREDEEQKIAGFTFSPQYDANNSDKGSFFVGDDNKLYKDVSQLTSTPWDERRRNR